MSQSFNKPTDRYPDIMGTVKRVSSAKESEGLANCHPSLSRGQVWCRECGRSQKVDSGRAMQSGWLKCCGYTMTIDSPEEQAQLASQRNKES